MLRGMFLVPWCLFLLPNLLFVPGTKILHSIENSAAPRRIVTRQTDVGTKKKINARLQLQPPSEKHDFMYVGRHTSQRPGSRYPRREHSTVGVRSKQNARKENRTCMRCVTRSLRSRAYFCRSAKQGCLSVTQEGRVSTPRCERVPAPSCAVPHFLPTKQTSARMAP